MGEFDDIFGVKSETPASNQQGTGEFDDIFGISAAPKRTVAGTAKDLGITALKGAIGVGEAVQGLADIPTGGRVGKFTEGIGYKPKQAKEILDTYLSPAQQAANKQVEQADGFVDTVGAAVQNPSTILHAGVESLPLMGAGGVAARGLMGALGTKVAVPASAGVAEVLAPKVAPWIAGAFGEGLVGAGSAAEQIRQQTEDGLLTAGQALAGVGSGLGTGAFNLVGGRLAQKFGFADPDTLLAQGLGKVSKEVAEEGDKGVIRRIIEGGISEGVFEEMPQSAQEQVWQNAALGKPLTEGVGSAMGMGMLTGAAMGAGVNMLPQGTPAAASTPPPQPEVPPNSPLTRAASMLTAGYATVPEGRVIDRRADPEGWARQEEAAKARNEQAINRGDVAQDRAKGGAMLKRDIPQADQKLTKQGKEKLARAERDAERQRERAEFETEYQRYIDPGLTEQEERQVFPTTAGMETEDRRREGEWTKQSKAAEDYNRRRNVRGEVDRTAREYDNQLGADFERALIDGGATLPLSKAEERAGRFGFPGTTRPMTAKQPEVKPNPRQREMDEFELAYNPDARASLMGTAMATDDKGRGEWLRQEKKALTQNKVRNFQEAQTRAKAINEQKRREQAEAEEARKRATDPLYDAKQRFQESYDAAGTIPQVDYPSDQAAMEFEQKVRGQQKDRQHREWVQTYRRKQAENKALTEDETIPPEVRKQAAKEAEDIVSADPVYGHMAEAKRRGKINLEAFGQDYDKDTIRQIIRRYPGIFSQVGTVQPDDFASEMGYASLDDMVRRFSEARTKTELTAQIIRERTGEWQQAEDAKQADDEFFAAKAERSDGGARWKGEPGGYQGRPLRTKFPAPEEEIGYMEDLIRRRPDNFTDDDLDHWTYTAEQQGRLRQALREAQQGSSGSGMSDNIETEQGQGADVAPNATDDQDLRGAMGTKAATTKSDAEGFVRDQQIRRTAGATRPATRAADTAGFVRDQQERREFARPVRPQGMPLDEYLKVVKAWRDEQESDLPGAGTETAPSPGEASNAEGQQNADMADVPETGFGNTERPVGGNSYTSIERELQQSAHKGRKDGDTEAPLNWPGHDGSMEYYVSMADAVKAARKFVAAGGRPVPFQIHNGIGVSLGDADIIIAMMDHPSGDVAKTDDPQGVEAELAATSDEDLDAMMDDVFGEEKPAAKQPKVPAKPRMTPLEKFLSDLEGKGAARDARGRGFKIVSSPADDGSFVLEVVDESGDRRTIGRPYPPGRGFSRAEATGRAVEEASFEKPARQAQPKPPKTAGQITKQGGIAALEGVKSAMAGLNVLFGGNNRLGSGLAFDEDTYTKANPHFVQAWNHAKEAGYSLKELLQYFHDQFGKAVRPYLERFLKDVKAGDLTAPEADGTVNQGDADQQTGGADNERADNARPDQPGADVTIRQDDGAVEGDGDSALGQLPPEVRQGAGETESAAGGGDQGGGKGTGGDQGTDGGRVPTPRGGRGRAPKVHPAQRGAGNNKRDGGSKPLADAPVTIPAQNFVITPDLQLGKGGEVAKFNDNVAAITTLKQILAEQRRATPEEQGVLAKYVGWGGLANAFKNSITGEIKPGWEKRVEQVEELLSPAELATARNSTQNAHYTSEAVVSAMWHGLQRLGFAGGIVLEPSVGTGNFLGLVPRDVAGKARFVAAEFDHITAGIAKLLYPKEAVFHTPFEKLPLPSNEFDAVIGNPPFGKTRLSFAHLPTINQYTIHNQFFLAGLDALKPGGVQAFVVSRYLMDAKDSTVREQIAKKAELLGAIRLPDVAFKENARTEVVTDIIFLRKKQAAGRQVDQDTNADETPQVAADTSLPAWVNAVDIEDEAGQEPITVNTYFANNPEMILGKLGRTGSMRRDNDVGVQYDGSDLGGDLVKIIDKALPEKIITPVDQESSAKAFESMATSLHLSLTGEEDGSVSIDDNGDLIHIYEKLSPSGAYLLARRVLTPESPWSNKLTLNHDGRWSEEVDLLGDDGKPVKRIINGKKTNRNEKTLKYYTEAEVPSTMRLGNDPYNRLRDAVGLLGMVKGQINLESSETASNDEIEAHRKKLDRAYDAFVSKHDHVNSGTVSKTVADVPNGALLLALEKSYTRPITKAKAKTLGIDPRPGSAEKADILSRRVIFPYSTPSRAENVDDALALNLSETGRVDLEMISSLLGKSEQEVIADLHDNLDEPLIFFDPELQSWEKADEYLGGNVVKKLNAARGAGLEKNVEALEKIQPKPWGADKVTILPGATWVPESVYTDFVSFLTDAPARVRFQKATNTFFVEADTITEKAKKWGTEERDVSSLVNAMLNSKTIRVTHYDRAKDTTVFDQEATEAAAMKIAEIKEEFSSWVFKDGDRRRLLVDLFNQKYNVRVLKQRNGQHLKLPGKVPDTLIRMRRHQMNAIWRGVVDRFVLYDHAVGAGKTFTGIARAMERRRMGLSKKPMIVVPNHLVEQFAADVYRLYPGAKVLAAGKKDLEKRKRRRLFAKIATGDWDVVIVPHSSFAFIGIHPDTELRYVEEELRIAEEAVREAEAEAAAEGYNGPGKPLTVKQAEALRDRLRARMESVRKGANNRDRLLTFEQMGVDDLTVDEAHEFKNLFYSSNMQARGMNPRAGSAKAYDLWTKIRTLRETNGSVAFMTGTPISNSAVEMYTMMRYLAADDLADMGMEHFDSWRAQFVDATTEFEPTESGRGLKEVNRLGRDWSNMRALMDLYYSFSDSVSNEDIQQWYREDNPGREFPIPKVKEGGRVGVNVKPTAAQEQLIQEIVSGFEGLQDIKPISLRNATRLRLMDAAKKVSLDARVLVPGLQSDEKGGKLDIASQRIADIYRKWTADKGTQLVFLDRSVPKQRGDKKRLDEYDKRLADLREAEQDGDEAGERKALEALEKYDHNEMETIRAAQAGGWNAYQQIKDNLVAAGIPEKEIRFVQDANTDEQKQELFDEVNSGSVRLLIGSTPRMGAGTNVQQRLVALHHVDVTWKPSDIEQREGRIIRQGNLFSTPPTESRPNPFFKPGFEVEILAYTTETTVDAKLWSLNSTKLRMINGIRQYNGEFNMEFDDEDSVGMAEIAAIASGNPLQLERVKLDAEIKKLERQQSAFNRQQWGARDRVESLERTIAKTPAKISFYGKFADKVTAAQEDAKNYLKGISVNVNGKTFTRDGSSHQAALDLVDDLAKQASEEKEKGFLVEIDGEKYRSADKAKAAIRAKMGDGLEFVFDFDGNRFISSDEARRHIADMANKAMEGKPDEIDDIALGDVSYQGMEFELTFSTEMDKDKEGKPLKLVGFHFDQKGVDPEDMAERITATAAGTVLRINNKINLNSLNLLFRNLRDKVKVVPGEADYWRDMMEDAKKSLPAAREMADQEFPKTDELDQKRQRLGDVEKELSASADKKGGGQQPTDDYIEQTSQGTATGEENITYAVSEPRGDGGQSAGVVRDRAGAGVRAGDGQQLDLFTGATVPSLHQRRAKRSVFAQVKHAAAGTFSFSGGPVGTMAEIAGIAKPIMDEAQESNLLVMLDENNMPVAVLKHSVGGKASGPIDPGIVLGVAHSIKAAKTIWSVHNHPSGMAVLSGADRNVATLLADATKGTGIEFAGMVAVTPGGRFTGAHYRDGEVVGGDFFGDAIADKGARVRGLTRKIKKLSDQPAVTNNNDISLWMRDNAPGQSGVLLLDNRNRPAAFVPMATATMAKLRTGEKGTGASELLAAAEQVNATALVPISTDRGKAGEDAARNIAVFAHAHAFTVLDALVDGQSARDLVRETVDDHKWRGGAKSAASAFFSKGEAVPAGDRADIQGELAKAFGKLRARVLMRKITVLESQEEAKALVARLKGATAKYSKNGAIQGIYANGKTYLVADGIAKDQAVPVLLHELGEHAAQLGFAGDREYQGILRSLEKRAEAQNATGKAIRAAMARVPEDTLPEHYWSEVAAYLVENKANGEIGIVKRILNFFKRWLYKAGLINADRFGVEDLVLFARAATLAHTGATYAEGVRQSPRYSVANNPAAAAERQRVLGDQTKRLLDSIAKNGLKGTAEQQLFATMAEGLDIVDTADADLKTKAWDWFKSLPKAAARKSLGALTLRQLRDVFAKNIPQMDTFYEASRAIAADANRVMTAADQIYNQWARLDKKDAKAMSEVMIRSTIAGVNPDVAKFEPRANLKRLQAGIDRNLARAAEIRAKGDAATADEKVERLQAEAGARRKAARIQNEVKRRSEFEKLATMYQGLSKEAKEVYQSVRKQYTDNLTALFDALKERVERQIKDPEQRKSAIDAIRLRYDKFIKEGPYFPLSRFGDYIAIAEMDGGARREVRTFDSMAERTRYTRARRAEGWTVQEKTKKEYNRETQGASGTFFEGVIKILNESEGLDAAERKSIIDEVNQHFIKSMPDLSHRKHFVHRRKVEGYSRDQMRAFADNMQHAAHHIARIRHADKMTAAVESVLAESRMLDKDANGDAFVDLHNELVKRLEIMNNPNISPATQALTSFGFLMNIGPSIASALVNISQTPLVAFPILANRFKGLGAITAMSALGKASADYFTSKPSLASGPSLVDNKRLPQEERDMIRALIDDGTIDVTQAHSLAQAAGSDYLNLARTKYGHIGARAMRLVAYPFHIAELANRKITALAAYRMARKSGMGHGEAVAATREAVLDSHFDYSQANRARWMEGNVRRVLLLFKQYSQQMTWLLGRSFHQAAKGETKEVRQAAARQLGMILAGHFMVAGAMGLPVLGGMVGALSFLGNLAGDDDEPKDLEVSLRNFLADTFGAAGGDAVMNGPWRMLPGLGQLDMANRMSLGDLWFRAPNREMEGRDQFNQYVNLILGPVANNAANVFMGANSMANGEVWRGVEMMLPKAIKDGMKAVRYSTEGVKNWKNDTLLEDLGAVELFGQALGFTPARVSEMYAGANAVKNYETRIERRRKVLMNQWVNAVRKQDAEGAREAMVEITAFNAKNPIFRIDYRRNLVPSLRNRMRVQSQTKEGVYVPATRDEIREVGRFANI